MSAERLKDAVERLHVLYLGGLPALATFAVLRVYGYPAMFLLFAVGVAAVGLYLAAAYHYTRPPASLWGNLIVLLDGPICVAASGFRAAGMPFSFAIEGFLVDGLAVALAILALVFVSPLPTRGQRVASIGIMAAVVAVLATLFAPYIRDVLWGDGLALAWLGFGIVEGSAVRMRLLHRAGRARPSDDGSILYIALLTLAWVVAMSAGKAVYDGI